MKIYNVLSEVESETYVDGENMYCLTMNVLGSFSTEEKANDFIKKLCHVPEFPSDEVLEPLYLAYVKNLLRTNEQAIKNFEEKLVEQQKVKDNLYLKAQLFPRDSLEQAQALLEWHKFGSSNLNKSTETYKRGQKAPRDFATWKSELRRETTYVPRFYAEDLTIQVAELDLDIVPK